MTNERLALRAALGSQSSVKLHLNPLSYLMFTVDDEGDVEAWQLTAYEAEEDQRRRGAVTFRDGIFMVGQRNYVPVSVISDVMDVELKEVTA